MRLFALACAVLLFSCPGGKPCTLHSDCPETERCVRGNCQLICRVDRDCEGLGSCVQGQCVLVVNGGGAGGSSGGSAGASAGGAAGGDAGGAAGATAGGAAGGTAGGAAGGTSGGAAGGTAGGAAGGTAGGAAGGTAGGGAQGQLGDPCLMASQCTSNLCVGLTGMSTGACTISCANESVCPVGWGCLSVGGINVCVPSDSGRSCSGGPSQCFAGICVGTGGNAVCATPCNTTQACPQTSRFTCSPSTGVNGRICIPAGASCSAAGTCSSNYCAVPDVNPSGGVCTGQCRDALDCPDTWGCGLGNGPGGTPVSVCQPAGAVCTVNGQGLNDCPSLTCAGRADGGADFCTVLCMNEQFQPQPTRCPAGWTCVPVQVGMDTWYACDAP